MEASDQSLADRNGLLDDGYERADPACLKVMYVRYILCFAAGAFIVVCIAGWLADNVSVWAAYMLYASFAVCSADKMVGPLVLYKKFRYEVMSDYVDFIYGTWNTCHAVMPIERIQSVEISDGPIMRMFGLVDVVINYAGHWMIVSFIRKEKAYEIAEYLKAAVIRIAREEK